eukprot:755029-Hanusia_phi.AAC.6
MPDVLGLLLSYCGCPRARAIDNSTQQELDTERARYQSMLDVASDNPAVTGTEVEKAFAVAQGNNANENAHSKKALKANCLNKVLWKCNYDSRGIGSCTDGANAQPPPPLQALRANNLRSLSLQMGPGRQPLTIDSLTTVDAHSPVGRAQWRKQAEGFEDTADREQERWERCERMTTMDWVFEVPMQRFTDVRTNLPLVKGEQGFETECKLRSRQREEERGREET